jgi:hypothetical protein
VSRSISTRDVTEHVMVNSQSLSRNAEDAADALLDQVVESALIEATAGTASAPALTGAAAPDLAEAFLQRAVAFLKPRPDGAALFERLRALLEDEPTKAKPDATSAPAAPNGKPE